MSPQGKKKEEQDQKVMKQMSMLQVDGVRGEKGQKGEPAIIEPVSIASQSQTKQFDSDRTRLRGRYLKIGIFLRLEFVKTRQWRRLTSHARDKMGLCGNFKPRCPSPYRLKSLHSRGAADRSQPDCGAGCHEAFTNSKPTRTVPLPSIRRLENEAQMRADSVPCARTDGPLHLPFVGAHPDAM